MSSLASLYVVVSLIKWALQIKDSSFSSKMGQSREFPQFDTKESKTVTFFIAGDIKLVIYLSG